MPSPVSIYLSNHQIIKVYNFAQLTVSNHYHRMWNDDSVGIQKIIIGKAGEVAIETYLKMNGIETENVNTRIDLGADKFDLQVGDSFISVKTKLAKCSVPSPSRYSQWFLHIPQDQYDKIKNSCDYIAAVFIGNISGNVEWESITSLKVDIIGIVSVDKFDSIKILHKAGQEIAEGFVLPPPDSYAVSWKDLSSFSDVVDQLRIHNDEIGLEEVDLLLLEKRLDVLEELFNKGQVIVPF